MAPLAPDIPTTTRRGEPVSIFIFGTRYTAAELNSMIGWNRLMLAATAAFVSACGSGIHVPPPPFQSSDATPRYYVVLNLDGPPVDLMVNDAKVIHLSCGMNGFDLAGEDGVAELPWDISLVRSDGSAMYSGHVDAVPESRKILIRGDEAREIPWYSSAGPPPRTPCPE